VLPRAARKRVTIEAESPLGWDRYAGDDGAIIGIDRFGASAPAEQIFKALGITADRLVEIGRKVVRDGLHGRVAAPAGDKH
jgi:transketolase